jgi:hypothetical protein
MTVLLFGNRNCRNTCLTTLVFLLKKNTNIDNQRVFQLYMGRRNDVHEAWREVDKHSKIWLREAAEECTAARFSGREMHSS